MLFDMFATVCDDIMLPHSPPTPINPPENNWKPIIEIAPSCPRCASSNTKFCYYNNYSLSQPRYFCKGCRRYWTIGGSLRNVPVGGGCRKSRHIKSKRSLNSEGQSSNTMAYHVTSVHGFDGDHDSLTMGNGATNGPDIDMVAMFAKFVNKDQELGEHIGEISSFDVSQSTTPESMEGDLMKFNQSANKLDLVQQANCFAGCLTNYDHNNNIVVEDNQDKFIFDKRVDSMLELQNSIINNDRMIKLDDLWCDASESESWGAMVQLQELDSFEELMNISSNSFDGSSNVAASDSDCSFWNSFDLSTCLDELIN